MDLPTPPQPYVDGVFWHSLDRWCPPGQSNPYLVAFGGMNCTGKRFDCLMLFSTASQQWAAHEGCATGAGPRPRARSGHISCIYGDILYIQGGCTEAGSGEEIALGDCWAIDLRPVAAALGGGRASLGQALQAARWTEVKIQMQGSAGLDNLRRFSHQAFCLDGFLVLFGGATFDNQVGFLDLLHAAW